MHVPQKRQRCPHCRALDVIPILYGLSALERLDAEARGEVIVGGPLPFAEQWHCRSCGGEWGRVPTETYPSRHALTA